MNNNDEFKLLLGRLTDDCPLLSIIITSNKGIKADNSLPGLKTVFLECLYPISSVQLFFEQYDNKQLEYDEIVDLIVKEKTYPI